MLLDEQQFSRRILWSHTIKPFVWKTYIYSTDTEIKSNIMDKKIKRNLELTVNQDWWMSAWFWPCVWWHFVRTPIIPGYWVWTQLSIPQYQYYPILASIAQYRYHSNPIWLGFFRKLFSSIIIIITIKNEKIRVTLCENAAGALYIVNKMCVGGQINVQGWNKLMIMSIVTRAE